MNIFVDTNVILDVILKRESYENSLIILNSIEKDLFRGFISDITLLNIDYIASKQVKDIKDFLILLNNIFTVVGANNIIFKEALAIDNRDLEDNVQYVCAKNNNCDCIITNDKKFYQGKIEILNTKTFINQYI